MTASNTRQSFKRLLQLHTILASIIAFFLSDICPVPDSFCPDTAVFHVSSLIALVANARFSLQLMRGNDSCHKTLFFHSANTSPPLRTSSWLFV